MVRTFAWQKFESLGVSIFAFFWWYAMRETESGTDYALLFSAQGIEALSIMILALSSWYLNLHAESSCAFETCHSAFYAVHAGIQDFLMFLCLFAFFVKDTLLVIPIPTVWRILALIFIAVIIILKYRETASTMRWAAYQKRQSSNAKQRSDFTFTYFLCILARFAAIIYTAYYIIVK